MKDAEYTIHLDQTSWKSSDLVYEEPGFQLVVYLERSFVRGLDWVGCDNEFEEWSRPHGGPIADEKRDEILERVQNWALHERVRIEFGPPINTEGDIEDMKRKGWTVDRYDDGSMSFIPPRGGLFKTLWNLFKR